MPVANAANRVSVGAYLAGQYLPDYTVNDPREWMRESYLQYQEVAGKEPAFVIVWWHGLYDWDFPVEACEAIWAMGAVPLVLMWPASSYGTLLPDDRLEALINGSRDAVFRTQVRRLATVARGRPVVWGRDWEIGNIGGLARGDGWAWSANAEEVQLGANASETLDGIEWPAGPALFVRVMRRITDLIRSEYANGTWLHEFCFQWPGYPDWCEPRWFFPGRNYTDIVGGGAGHGPTFGFNTFRTSVTPVLEALRSLPNADGLTRFIEIGGPEDFTDPLGKAKYFKEVFESIAAWEYPELLNYGLLLETWHDRDERDWGNPPDYPLTTARLDSSSQSRDAYRAGIADPFYSSHLSL